eukprot:TRINITY_DN22388_c0_g1_i1.p1 TRINITY_DN22388_c0_g1~~TRINITY_DN22388_c0_g1_i1.p1  ORF type:complete len:147 (-),score=22.36 TRINITY_DN22388_c0_g1_i1:71-511(-)
MSCKVSLTIRLDLPFSSTDSSDMIVDDKIHFVGFVEWAQECRTQSDDVQNRLMNELCEKKYPGTRAATADEYILKKVKRLPPVNISGRCCTFCGPGNSGTPNVHAVSGHSLVGVRKGKALDGSWSSRNLYSSVRCCVAVKAKKKKK